MEKPKLWTTNKDFKLKIRIYKVHTSVCEKSGGLGWDEEGNFSPQHQCMYTVL